VDLSFLGVQLLEGLAEGMRLLLIGVSFSIILDVYPVDGIHPTPDEEEFEAAEHLHINPL
jgi:hypothetical protein